MSDLALKRISNGEFDLDFDGLDLLTSDGLENAVVISIGTYARERSLQKGVANIVPKIGGWWGDSTLSAGDTLGCYIYEAFREKLTDGACDRVKDLVNDALKWMVTDGVAKSVTSTTAISGENQMTLSIKIVKPEGSPEYFVYELNWENTLK